MIKVEHIQASLCQTSGCRIDTLILEYPRVIHAQLLTHRVFSKNSSSTRAIPLKVAVDQVLDYPAEYIWTENQAGMQGELVEDEYKLNFLENIFANARNAAIDFANQLSVAGAHKQNCGRLLEPFQNIRIVLTSTQWKNWDWLRDHGDAQSEIAELAAKVSDARNKATPLVLKEGEWHVPFVNRTRAESGELLYSVGNTSIGNETILNAEEAKLISMSVCAQTSYRKGDYSLEKAIDLSKRLLESERVHASPSEHQATPIPIVISKTHCEWPKGVTHVDRKHNYWSGNFKGFIQHRQLLKNHDKELF